MCVEELNGGKDMSIEGGRKPRDMRSHGTWTLPVVVFALAVTAACAPSGPTPAQTAEVIYTGGDIVTINDGKPTVEALAVKDGKILAVGARADLEKAHKGAATEVVDLGGKTLMPSFIDGHGHYINSLSVANQAKLYAPPAGHGKDVDSIIAAVKKFAEERNIPKGQMIMGYGYDENVMPGGRLLNRDDLDAAFPDNPVRIDHVSMHGCVLNSAALKYYGISAETETPPGGVIVRKPGTNEPYGLIMETAFLPVFGKSEPMSTAQEAEWTKAGQMLYAEAGVTTAHDGATHLAQFQTMKRATEAGANLIDVVAFPFITDLEKILQEAPWPAGAFTTSVSKSAESRSPPTVPRRARRRSSPRPTSPAARAARRTGAASRRLRQTW